MARRSLWKIRLSEKTLEIHRGLVSRYIRVHPNESEPWLSVLAMLEEAREIVGSDDDEPAATGPGRLSPAMIARGTWLAAQQARRLGLTEVEPGPWTRRMLWRLGSSLIATRRVRFRMARRSLWKVRLSESTVKLQRGLVSRYTRVHPNESEPWISVLAMLEDARELVGSDDDDPAPTGPGRLSSRMIARGIWLAGRRARELGWTEADPRSWTREVLWRLMEIMPLDWPIDNPYMKYMTENVKGAVNKFS